MTSPRQPICAWCGRSDDDWRNEPCDVSPDRLHWRAQELADGGRADVVAVAQSLRRAAYELDRAANAADEATAAVHALPLPRRARIAARRASAVLHPDEIRDEAERARDTLHVYGLLDV